MSQQNPPNQMLTLPGVIGGPPDSGVMGVPPAPWWRRRWVIAVAAILLIAIIGVLALTVFRPKSTTPLQTARVTQGNLDQTISATGPLQSASYNLTFAGNNTALITEIDVKVGQAVKKGQTLAKVDPTALQSTYDTQNQKLQTDQATLNNAYATLAKDQGVNNASTGASQTNVNGANASLGADQTVNSTTIANDQSAVDQAQTALNNAQTTFNASVTAARATLNSALGSCAATATASAGSVSATATAIALIPTPTPRPNPPSSSTVNSTFSNCEASAQAAYNVSIANAQSALTTAQNNLTNAQNALNAAQANVAKTNTSDQNSINSNQASLNSTTASNASKIQSDQNAITSDNNAIISDKITLAENKYSLGQATLNAPHDGTITAINGAVGGLPGVIANSSGTSTAGGSSTSSNSTFIQLVDLASLQVQANVNEADVSNVQVGQPATFSVNSYTTRTFKGTVSAITPAGQTSSNVVSYPVLIDVDPTSTTGANLYPNMTANVNIITVQRNNVLTIPINAVNFARNASSGTTSSSSSSTSTPQLITRQEAATARQQATQMLNNLTSQNPNITTTDSAAASFVIEPGTASGQYIAKPIVIGLTDGTSYEVLQGLTADETIIVGTRTSGSSSGTPSTGGSGGGTRSGAGG